MRWLPFRRKKRGRRVESNNVEIIAANSNPQQTKRAQRPRLVCEWFVNTAGKLERRWHLLPAVVGEGA